MSARRVPTESTLVTAILKALTLKGYWAWRANSGTQVLGATSKSARRVIRGAPAGTPDILVVVPRSVMVEPRPFALECMTVGTLAGLEVKTATGQQRSSQRLWQQKAERHGVRYAVVRGVSEALAAVENWRTGKVGG